MPLLIRHLGCLTLVELALGRTRPRNGDTAGLKEACVARQIRATIAISSQAAMMWEKPDVQMTARCGAFLKPSRSLPWHYHAVRH